MFCLLLAVLTAGCYQDPVFFELEELEDKVVIEGLVVNGPGPNRVRVSRPLPLGDARSSEPMSGAEVVLEESTGIAETLTEVEAGVFETQRVFGVPGRTYGLTVTVDGEMYRGTSTMPEVVFLDSLRVRPEGGWFSVHCYFRDRPGEEDYHWLRVYEEGRLSEESLYQGTHSDGDTIAWEVKDKFDEGDRISVEFFTLERAAFEYITSIRVISDDYSASDPGDFDPEMPAFVPVMMHNPKTNLSNGALGFFFAVAVRVYELTI